MNEGMNSCQTNLQKVPNICWFKWEIAHGIPSILLDLNQQNISANKEKWECGSVVTLHVCVTRL